MSNFDNPGIYYQERFFANDDALPDEGREMMAEYRQMADTLRRFLREFSLGGGFNYIYRNQLQRNYTLGEFHIEVDLEHLKNFDEDAEQLLRSRPARFLPAFEEAAKQVADEITRPRPVGQEKMHDIQVMLASSEPAVPLRHIKSAQVSQLVRITGIVVAAAQTRNKATKVSLQCRTCRHQVSNLTLKPGLDGFQLPRSCGAPQAGQLQRCPVDPYQILPDKCECVDYQTLKLQENPEDVPHGEMPRHLQLYADRALTDTMVPGNRVSIIGVFSIKRVTAKNGKSGNTDKTLSGVRAPYLRILGVHVETAGPGRATGGVFNPATVPPDEERAFKEIAKRADAYELIAKSIAPSIYGSTEIKRSIACLLFGGSRKRLPDGITRRGDINLLLLGDPGTAKSQLLKFVEQASPIGIYTSGKGSSAAGLTAAVMRDPSTRSFVMEGGAMVLGDGGVVCIDEFDKMREDDRVAIHEAMEQQTISIAKAGITTTLNSRCSVLAAANSVFGRWDDAKGDENIDFMPTILSRFDMIYVVRDTHDEKRDAMLARHVVDVHISASSASAGPNLDPSAAMRKEQVALKPFDDDGFLTIAFIKKYVAFARATCAPRLSEQAASKLVHHYVRMRNPPRDDQNQIGKASSKSAIPITVRQLEAVVRISEALAKMELAPFAVERHVDEALRLFRVSTLEAAKTGQLAGIEGFTSLEDQESLQRIERQLKRRFAVGTHVSEYLVVQDFVRQHYDEALVKKVIAVLVRRGDLVYKMQRKMLYRVH